MKLSHGSTDVTNLDKLFADGLGMSVLKGIDPVGTNLVAAGIFVGKNGQLPTLTRVEVNVQMAMCRVTLKTASSDLSAAIMQVIEETSSVWTPHNV